MLLASPGYSAGATAISPDGQVVAGFGNATASDPPQVLVWDSAGLHETGISTWGNEPWGVSDVGHIVAGTMTGPGGGPEGFIWSLAGGFKPLGTIAGDVQSEARAISSDGTTVVGSVFSATGFRQAASLTPTLGWQTLSELPGGDQGSVAMSISANDSVIVGQVDTTAGYETFIWDPVHGMQLLQNVLTENGANLNGWTLNRAQSVSDNSLTIAGGGTDPAGHEEGWVATIPSSSVLEPSPMAFIFVAAIAAFVAHRPVKS